jgi:putative flippase GtrA
MKEVFRFTLARFFIAGSVNALFGWCAYSITILIGVKPWAALVAGNVMGVAFNFLTLGGYAFRDLSLARLPSFFAVYTSLYAINLFGLHAISLWIAQPIWAQLILTPPMALLSFVLLSYFVFPRSA